VIGADVPRHKTVGQWRTDMTNGTSGAVARRPVKKNPSVQLSYLKIRDVSTKDEEANGASTYIAVLPATQIVKIGTEGNLRSTFQSTKARNEILFIRQSRGQG
jgi:hypothetical protein